MTLYPYFCNLSYYLFVFPTINVTGYSILYYHMNGKRTDRQEAILYEANRRFDEHTADPIHGPDISRILSYWPHLSIPSNHHHFQFLLATKNVVQNQKMELTGRGLPFS